MAEISCASSPESSKCSTKRSVLPTNDPESSLTLAEKTLEFCKLLKSAYTTPKQFILAFLTADNDDLAFRQRYWGTKEGWPSTCELLGVIKDQVTKTKKGKARWREFIKNEAIEILNDETPPRGYYPAGSFHSSKTVEPSFFDHEAACTREETITKDHMPFLFNMLMGALPQSCAEDNSIPDDLPPQADPPYIAEKELMEWEEMEYEPNPVVPCRFQKMAGTICSVVAFAKNRHCNGLQLFNSIRFTAGGVSELIKSYLHRIGLTASQQTALSALTTSSIPAACGIKTSMEIDKECPIGPSICINNLDIEERVHTQSVGNQTMMFHGTRGYIHKPNPNLLKTLDYSQLTLKAYYKALAQIPSLQITPSMFFQTDKEDEHFEAVLKSQISRVMRRYVGKPMDNKNTIPSEPPIIEQIDCTTPHIQVLKLMDASDNSAKGVGQVLVSIISQTGLTPEEFCPCIQVMDGDLGTCQNLNSLRALQTPCSYAEHALLNITMELGLSHTLWNIS
ncbi:hypothetical protein Pst134EA_007209 [Puccinia striiformis f. sp. tritici]|uniref:DUF6589 domain-containing protein n=3 Tax=Puccinia striiformis TaxID=27350 RepID=A0A0L0UUX7_9BASI|nr:hypothetical protein Pst134EA_007209 [Puccinia striiformis f. sp. tritici]KAH9460145.1 hypothetical protein Pst134EB_008343 [Puccinia striiformis f. sp. tritici]KAH9469936.1 hypothetical protein Pst134EA_007209 [Puccinia striiformis f. sp. tritici]KNE90544.1 hypothetical protein PSTG_16006 [Puccinia striiformis f. sp. tritici PST-78]POW06770.1 hypothetical protein PSTT_08728 [Puccinia striiformis]